MIQCVRNKMCLKLVILLIVCRFTHSSTDDFMVNGREKRTIDLFLRGVADTFGYDILKRPTVLPPVTTPVMVVSTYPPPLAPFAPRQNPKPQQSPLPPKPQQPPLTPTPQLPPSPQPPPVPPKSQPQPLPSPNPKPVAPLPKAPPQPPTASPPMMPLPSPTAAPPPPAPSRLIETIRKTFNLNFNWNKNLQPQPSNATSAIPPQAVPATTQKSAPLPTSAIAATTLPPTLQNAGGQQFLHKPQLYEEYDYGDKEEFKRNEKEPKMTLGEKHEKQSNRQNAPQDDNGNDLNQEPKTQPSKNSDQQRIRFQESVNEFWKNYPFTEQEGYKYIMLPEQQVLTNAPNNHLKTDKLSLKENADNSDEYETKAYFYFLPRNYETFNGDGPHRFSLNKEVEQVPKNNKKSERSRKQPQTKERSSGEKEVSESVAHPLFSGVLPIQLHHLAKEEGSLKPWSSVPYYDYEYGATENKHNYAPKESVSIIKRKDVLDGYECCGTNFEFYTVPEPEPMDYSKYEMLHIDSDKLSKNATIKTKQNMTTFIKANNYKDLLKY